MASDSGSIRFHYLYPQFGFRNRNALKAFINGRFNQAGRLIETINYIFCDDEYLASINRQYLLHDTYTDIITFELSDKTEPVLSDIFISIARVKENAAIYKASFNRELHRVVFHGALHLLGFKDKTDKQSAEMRRLEEEWLNAYFVSRSTVSP